MKRRARGRNHATKIGRPERRARPEAVIAVVGIGASTGGFDALRRFFSAARSDSEMVFIVVQHLDPVHESLAAEVIGRYTPMPVVQVGSDTPRRSIGRRARWRRSAPW